MNLFKHLYVSLLCICLYSIAYADSHFPCGDDGSECQCGKNEWVYSYQGYKREKYEIVDHGLWSPSCENRTECLERYHHTISEKRKAAIDYRRYAEADLEYAKAYKEDGDEKYYEISMSNHRWHTVEAKKLDMQADSAIPPHCDLEKVQERLAKEFKEPDSVDWVIPPQSSTTTVGASVPFNPSKRTQQALLDMQNNYKNDEVIAAIVMTSPLLMLMGSIDSPSPVMNLIIDDFPWKAWDEVLGNMAKDMHTVGYRNNYNICMSNYLYWDSHGRSRTPEGRSERQFWGKFCRSM